MFVTIALLIFASAGCNRDRPQIMPVSGRVLLDGKPLAFGVVQFSPPGARSSYGNLDKDCYFRLTCRDSEDGAVPGLHAVTINGGEVLKSTDTSITTRWHAPKKYADAATSGLTQEISAATDKLVFNLTGEGQPFVPFVETIDDRYIGKDFGGMR
jgi:hypothetical protein